jgi:hypothetical protein
MTNRALLVGVSHYSERSGFRELKAPVSDVKRLQECLKLNGGFEVVSLIDASRQEVERQVRSLLTRAKTEDRIVFYYSGHGETTFPRGELLLALADYDQEDPEGGSIEKRKLFEWARDGAAGQLVMILDCCFAAAGTSDVDHGRSSPALDRSDFTLEREGGGTHILMASDGHTRAQSGDVQTADGRASHFTDLLVRGLEGDAAPGEDRITIRKLCDFLHDRAPTELKARPRVNVEDGYGDFPLVMVQNPDRTLIPRELRDGATSLRPVERMGTVTLLGRMLAMPLSERHINGARELLEEIRESPTSQDDVRRAAGEALSSVQTAPRQVLEEEISTLKRSLELREAEADEALAKLAAAQEHLTAIRFRQAEADTKVTELHETVRRLEHKLQDDQRASEALALQTAELQSSLAKALDEKVDAERQAEQATKRLANLPARPEPLEDPELGRLRNQRDAARSDADEFLRRASLSENQVKLLTRQTEALSEEVGNLRTRLAESGQHRDALICEGEDVRREIAVAELSALAAERRSEARQKELQALQNRVTELDADLFKLREANTALRNRSDHQDQTIHQQITELSRIKDLLSRYEGRAKEELLDEMQMHSLENQISAAQAQVRSLEQTLTQERAENEVKVGALKHNVADLTQSLRDQIGRLTATKRAFYMSCAIAIAITVGALLLAMPHRL